MNRIALDSGKSKTGSDDDHGTSPWFKCFPRSWLKDTRGLSLEQRAVYWDCLCVLYETERPIPRDDKWMSHQLHISTRLWRSIRDGLVKGGFLVETADGFINSRASEEIEQRANQRRTKSESAVKREQTKREKPEKSNDNNETEAQKGHYAHARKNLEDRKIEREDSAERPEQEPARAEPGPAAPPDLKILETRLLEACNGSLDNPANCMGLLSLATPQMWLERGADLEMDVLPTLKAAGRKYHGKKIRDWNYFTPMISEAVAKRSAKLPEAAPGGYVDFREVRRAEARKLLDQLRGTA